MFFQTTIKMNFKKLRNYDWLKKPVEWFWKLILLSSFNEPLTLFGCIFQSYDIINYWAIDCVVKICFYFKFLVMLQVCNLFFSSIIYITSKWLRRVHTSFWHYSTAYLHTNYHIYNSRTGNHLRLVQKKIHVIYKWKKFPDVNKKKN